MCLLAAVGAAGCGGGDNGSGGGPTDKPAPAFPPNQGQPANGSAGYPAGPYGVGIQSVIENYHFVGFANAQKVDHALQEIQLADFYNPHADDPTYKPATAADDDRLFPAGSPYGGGTEKPKVLLIDVASVWCGPCNEEAGSILPELRAAFAPCGGEFLLQLADGPTPGVPAVQQDLFNWTSKYKVDYPATIDPSSKLSALWQADAYPENMIIDTRTMKIITVIAGAPNPCPGAGDTFWTTYEKTLNNPQCPMGTAAKAVQASGFCG